MDEVSFDIQCPVASNGSRRCLGGIGAAHGFPHLVYGLLALPRHGDYRPRCHELHHAFEESLAHVRLVMLVGQYLVHLEHLASHQLQAVGLQAGYDRTCETSLQAVGLQQYQGSLFVLSHVTS